MSGELPGRPKNPTLADGLWRLTKRCLERKTQRRPKIAEVTSYLRRILTGRQGGADVASVAGANDTTLGRTLSHRVFSCFRGSQDTRRSVRGLAPEDRMKFITAADQLTGHLDDVWLISIQTTSRSSLSQILDNLNPLDPPSRKCPQVLQKLCSSRAIPPLGYEVSGELSITTTQPVAFGGFCDVYKGTLGGADVCIKRLRISTMGGRVAVKQVTYRCIFS